MSSFLVRPPAWIGGLFLCVALGCSSSSGGGPGGGGSGGTGSAFTAGLWEGQSDGLRVCFFVQSDGLALTASTTCNVTRPEARFASSYDLEVEEVGRDESGQPCSFALSAALDVPIDPDTGAFAASFTDPGTGADLSFSGELDGIQGSGVARANIDGSSCSVGWSAAPLQGVCDELFSCCRAILVNPVFFESCRGVVDEGNETQCLSVLLGYPRCSELDR